MRLDPRVLETLLSILFQPPLPRLPFRKFTIQLVRASYTPPFFPFSPSPPPLIPIAEQSHRVSVFQFHLDEFRQEESSPFESNVRTSLHCFVYI